MRMCRSPGGGGARKDSCISGSGLTAPAAPAPLEPAEDVVLSGAESVMPDMLNCDKNC